jgi:hypothetical protein
MMEDTPQVLVVDWLISLPRAAPRVMMKATDHGFCDETPDTPELGHMVCGKCGHDAGWMHFATRTKVKRGEPCPVCNKKEST